MRKLIMILCVLLCISCVLCACGEQPTGNAEESTQTSTTSSTEDSKKPVDDGKVTYTVKVIDENGNGITGGMIQFCLDACMPCPLDANGVASMKLAEADYKVSFTVIPTGYELAGDKTEFYFDDGSYEMTITLKAAG